MDTIDFNKQRTSRLSWQSIELRIVLIASLLAIGFVFWILGSMPSSMFWDNINWFGPSHSAITEFTKAVNLEPDNEQAYLLLADAYQLNGDLASVQQVWQDATRKNRDVKWAYKHQAQFHQSFRQNDDVVRTWQQAVFENPYASWGYIELAKFHLLTKNWSAAEATWQSAIEANQNELWPYQQLANYYKTQKEWVLVGQTYRRAIQQLPNEPSAYQLLGNHLFNREDWQGAIDAYKVLLTVSPELASGHLNLGRSLLRLNQTAAGIENLEQAVLLEPSEANYKILQQELNRLSFDTQVASYERILALAPDDLTIRSRLVTYYQNHEDCSTAIAIARKGTSINDSEAAYQLLANTLYGCGELDGAITVYATAASHFPYQPQLPLQLGKLQLEQGNLREAVASFVSGLQLQETPQNYQQVNQWFINSLPVEQAVAAMQATIVGAKPAIEQPYQRLIQNYRLLGQPQEAISVMTLATLNNPKSAWGYTELAKLYIEQERTEDALATFDLAIGVEPENKSMHYSRAQFLYGQGDISAAIRSYQNAHELDPNNRTIQTRFGRALIASGQLEHGARLMELAYQAKPDNNTYRFIRKAYQEHVTWPASQPYQERAALLRWSDNPVAAYANLANIYANTDEPKAAAYTYHKVLTIDPENLTTLTQLTSFYLSQSDCKSANQYGLKAAKISPGSATYLHLADVYGTCGPPEAMQIAQQRSVEGYVVEQTPQSQKKNVVDRAIHRYRDVLFEDQVITYLADALATLELDRVEPYMQLGWYYEAVVDPPDPQQAVAQYQRAMQVHPDSFDAAVALGRVLHDGGAPEEAVAHYRKAILLNQNDQGVRVRYGRALVESSQVEQGQAVLASALKLEQSDWYTDYAIEGYFSSQPASEALGYITETLTLVPPVSEDVYMSPVRYYLDLGENAAAVKILELAIANNPDLDWPHVKLSYVYRGLKENELAIEQMQSAIQKQPRTAWNHHDLGLLYRANGNLDEALLSLAQAAVLDPKNAWAHIYYGQVLLESGQFERGKSELVVALKAEQTNDVYAFVDTLLKKHLTVEDARNIYALLLEDDPQNQLAQQYLGLWAAE